MAYRWSWHSLAAGVSHPFNIQSHTHWSGPYLRAGRAPDFPPCPPSLPRASRSWFDSISVTTRLAPDGPAGAQKLCSVSILFLFLFFFAILWAYCFTLIKMRSGMEYVTSFAVCCWREVISTELRCVLLYSLDRLHPCECEWLTTLSLSLPLPPWLGYTWTLGRCPHMPCCWATSISVPLGCIKGVFHYSTQATLHSVFISLLIMGHLVPLAPIWTCL